ncbi:uncharacterized protein K02A2.6-like [Cydia pomonella]|uniref:uncharacterized protein K02A2.6-like n=1 Tax=Cydia pomonella TaxID=82600 RepID=UPI002ADE1C29|nr:uncharacterized protein K02A2.6-like [Cydia pomonella]
MIGSCDICNQLRPSPPRVPLAVWPYPKQAFHRVHIDFLGPINNRSYLVLVDAYSKWVEVYSVSSTSTAVVISKLYEFMSRFGLIHTLVSDNATCFLSDEFRAFCAANGISHITSPAYHAASNGQAESYVKVAKKGIRSCLMFSTNQRKVDENLCKYLFDYRNSVHVTTGTSPAQILFGRKLRSRWDLLYSPPLSPSSSHTHVKTVERKQCSQSKSFGGKKRPFFKPGDYVMYKKNYGNKKFIWNKGKIIKQIGRTIYLVKDHVTLVQVKKHVNQLVPIKGVDVNRFRYPSYQSLDETEEPSVNNSGATNEIESSSPVASGSHEPVSSSPAERGEENGTSDGSTQVATSGGEAEGFLEVSDDNVQPQQVATPADQSLRGGLSGMLLRPLPRTDYKPFYCMNYAKL